MRFAGKTAQIPRVLGTFRQCVGALMSAIAAIGCAPATPAQQAQPDVAAEIAADSAPDSTTSANEDAAKDQNNEDVERSADAGRDRGAIPLPCDETPVVNIYKELAFMQQSNCGLCHGSSGRQWMGKPGPTWLMVGDPLATVRQLIHRGFIQSPAQSSPLLRAMIPIDEGGMLHTGGTRMHKGDSDWLELLNFVTVAQKCVP